MGRWAAATILAVSLMLGACGDTPAAAPPPPPPPCALPSLPPDAGIGGPAVQALRGGAAASAFSLDGGDLKVAPPAAGQQPSVTAAQAECAALAALNSNNAPLVEAALQNGMAIGYGQVSLAPGLLAGAQPPPAYPAPASLPKPTAYQGRLAWVLVVKEDLVVNCPAMMGPAPARAAPSPGDHGYGVFLLDARTGGDALLYVEGHPAPCGGTRHVPPALTIPVDQVSVPWTLISRNPDGYSARIRATVLPCDVHPATVLVERGQPVARVLATQPVGASCGARKGVTLALHAATVTSNLPAKIGHAPVGLYIALPRAAPPVHQTGVLRTLGPSDAGRSITVGVGSVLVVTPWPGLPLRGPNPAVSSDNAVLGPLDGANRGPVAEFRAWKPGGADLSIPASACASPASKSPPCSGPWVVHVTVTRASPGAG